jgi:hypothetical protein
MVKRPNLTLHTVDEGVEIQAKGVENLFNEIIEEVFLNLCKNIDSHIQ